MSNKISYSTNQILHHLFTLLSKRLKFSLLNLIAVISDLPQLNFFETRNSPRLLLPSPSRRHTFNDSSFSVPSQRLLHKATFSSSPSESRRPQTKEIFKKFPPEFPTSPPSTPISKKSTPREPHLRDDFPRTLRHPSPSTSPETSALSFLQGRKSKEDVLRCLHKLSSNGLSPRCLPSVPGPTSKADFKRQLILSRDHTYYIYAYKENLLTNAPL